MKIQTQNLHIKSLGLACVMATIACFTTACDTRTPSEKVGDGVEDVSKGKVSDGLETVGEGIEDATKKD